MGLINTKIQIGSHNRSDVDLSNVHVCSSDFGRLDVVYNTELVPGDSLEASISSYLRAAPLVAPVFGKVKLNLRAFFVPYRILWQNNTWFNKFVTGQDLSETFPYVTIKYIKDAISSLVEEERTDCMRFLSQLGIPPSILDSTVTVSDSKRINPLSMAAYQRIWYDYYGAPVTPCV